jgi:hypothetical protein
MAESTESTTPTEQDSTNPAWESDYWYEDETGGTKYTSNPDDTVTYNKGNTRVENYKDTFVSTKGTATTVVYDGKLDTVYGTKTSLDFAVSTAISLAPKYEAVVAPFGLSYKTGANFNFVFLEDFKLFPTSSWFSDKSYVAINSQKKALAKSDTLAESYTNAFAELSEAIAAVQREVGTCSETYATKSETITNLNQIVSSVNTNYGYFSMACPLTTFS